MDKELGHPLRDGLSSQAMEPQASPPKASIPDAIIDGWNKSQFRITDYAPAHRQFRLSSDLTVEQITAALGIQPHKRKRKKGQKVTIEWKFYAEKNYHSGEEICSVSTCCQIWDYNGERWSAYGFPEAFEQVGLTPLFEKDYGSWVFHEAGNPTISLLTRRPNNTLHPNHSEEEGE